MSGSRPTSPQTDDEPDALCCPISKTLMTDPVVACDGHSYEKSNIVLWFQTKQTSPLTGLPLSNRNLIPNITLKKIIQDFREKRARQSMGQRVVHHSGYAIISNAGPSSDSWTCEKRGRVNGDYEIQCTCVPCCLKGEELLRVSMNEGKRLRDLLKENGEQQIELIRQAEKRSYARRCELEKVTADYQALKADTASYRQEREQAMRQEQERRDAIRAAREVELEDQRRRQMAAQEAERARQEAATRQRQRQEEESARQAQAEREAQEFWYNNFVVVNPGENFVCLICDVRESYRNPAGMRRHVQGGRHDANVTKALNYDGYAGSYYCPACVVSVKSRKTFMQHLTGARHDENTRPAAGRSYATSEDYDYESDD